MMLGSNPIPPLTWNDEVTRDLNKTYPKAVDGDAVVFYGPSDATELWIKNGSQWDRGWAPGSGPGMTMEARPDYKRIIADLTQSLGPGLPPTVEKIVTTTTSVDVGKLALIGLLGLLLLRGAVK
jgi:hypothetical protein